METCIIEFIPLTGVRVRTTILLTMHKKRCGRNLIAAVFIGECGGLFDRGEMFCGGWCVNMTHLYPWGG